MQIFLVTGLFSYSNGDICFHSWQHYRDTGSQDILQSIIYCVFPRSVHDHLARIEHKTYPFISLKSNIDRYTRGIMREIMLTEATKEKLFLG